MSVAFNVNKFNLLDVLKFPTQQYHKEHKIYKCKDREWIVDTRNVYHSYKNSTETNPDNKFGLLYVDTENLEEYYKVYPNSQLKEY